MAWRLLTADGVAAAEGLAGDEILAKSVGAGRSPATLKLYTYRPHCALVGRFQEVGNEIRLAFCAEHGVQVSRRPTGGGAIVMGPDQLGVALAVDGKVDAARGRPRELMARFSSGLSLALRHFGIEAGFHGKNDLEVGGRKIAGLGIYRDPSGGLLFHASLLVDLDVELMAHVLRMPFADVSERELRILAHRTTTVREWSGAGVSMDDVRARVAASFAEAFGVVVEPSRVRADEVDAAAALAREKYADDGWVFRRADVKDATGSAAVDTPTGTVEAHVAVAGRMIKAVHIRGDFFADDGAVADLERRLRWHPAEDAAVAPTVRAWSERNVGTDVPAAALIDAIKRACASSNELEAPYGCFVTPRGTSA